MAITNKQREAIAALRRAVESPEAGAQELYDAGRAVVEAFEEPSPLRSPFVSTVRARPPDQHLGGVE